MTANYNPNVLESTDAWIRQWYNFTAKQLNNIISDSSFAAFYEKYFLIGAEKIKGKGYTEVHTSLMADYKHVLRKNKARFGSIESRRKFALQMALILIAVNYLPLGVHNIGVNELVIAAKKLNIIGIGM